jgi:hypothetical protein
MADLHGTVKLQIMFAGEGVWLEGIPVKWVADIDVFRPTPLFPKYHFARRAFSLHTLTATQKKRLQEFIRRYTSGNN